MIRPIYVTTGAAPNKRMRRVMVHEMSATRKFFSGSAAKKGRPRRLDVDRYPSGRIINKHLVEKPEDVLETALSARARRFGIPKDQAREPLFGSALGRLRLAGEEDGISPRQYNAGVRVARLLALQHLLDDVRPAYGVPILGRLASPFGKDPYGRLDPEQAWDDTEMRQRLDIIAKIRRDAAEFTRAVWEMETQDTTRGAGHIITRVVMWDDDAACQSAADRGVLRCGLNVVAHLFGMDD
jgi:hypothetical protein